MMNDKFIIFQEGKWLILFNKISPELKFIIPECRDFVSEIETINLLNTANYKSNTFLTQDSLSEHYLEKLTICCTDSCNLACRYCYLNAIPPQKKDRNLPFHIAIKAINRILEKYPKINHINFFGGEPLLNLELIYEICTYFKYLKTRGIISVLPNFGLTTNGTILNDKVLTLLSSNNIQVTISLDGPLPIHDYLRQYKIGGGTFDKICQNIIELMNRGFYLDFECTYTMEHYKRGISINNLLDFFFEMFNCSILHIPIVVASLKDSNYFPPYIAKGILLNSIDYSISNLFQSRKSITTFVYRLVNCLSTQIPIRNYCPANGNSIFLNSTGFLYPCSMLSNNHFLLGSYKKLDYERFKILSEMNGDNNENCKHCWAKNICFGCIAEDHMLSNSMISRSSVPGQSEICDVKRELIEHSFRSIFKSYLSSRPLTSRVFQ
jgi:uncharacterized protein